MAKLCMRWAEETRSIRLGRDHSSLPLNDVGTGLVPVRTRLPPA